MTVAKRSITVWILAWYADFDSVEDEPQAVRTQIPNAADPIRMRMASRVRLIPGSYRVGPLEPCGVRMNGGRGCTPATQGCSAFAARRGGSAC